MRSPISAKTYKTLGSHIVEIHYLVAVVRLALSVASSHIISGWVNARKLVYAVGDAVLCAERNP